MQLRDYQTEAVTEALAVMRDGGGFGLWLEQRTGKTPTALEIAKRCQPRHLWIVCPKGAGAALEMWANAVKEWRRDPEAFGIKVCIENYEQFVMHRKARYAEARKLGRELFLLIDEAHYIKRRGTGRSRALRHVARYARWRLALTGTPISKGIEDTWALLDFINPELLGPWDDKFDGIVRTHIGFESKYLVWGKGKKKHDIVAYNNEEEFYALFHANSYRKTLHEARPTRLLLKSTRVPVPLDRESRKVYDTLKKKLVAEANKRRIKVKNVLGLLVKLQQITGGWVRDEEGRTIRIGREKMEQLRLLVRRFRAREKFVIVARFVHEIERIASMLESLGYSVQQVRGGQPYDNKFRTDCVVMQIQSGIAVDMAHANDLIYYSMDYSMVNFEQSRFRILNYDKPFARFWYLLVVDTIDELIYTAVREHQDVARFICDTYRNRGNAV